MKISIVRPAHGHSAYRIAAETFASLAAEVSGAEAVVYTDAEVLPDDFTPVVVIGTDAVNRVSADMYFNRETDDYNIRYGTDDYHIRTQTIKCRKYLFLAGGRPRSGIYAVYRYFELFCGCRWFWDGDRIKKTELKFDGIDTAESPRFDYRGLRYFAHRSLHRFQAEHWSFEDWKTEIDWILKKRLNLFMLRIGLDDVFQKAFPECVKYPDRDEPLPEAGEGYDDRSLFWSLEYRGELRKKLLQYAFERDLMHPEDCGTMTHWYSRTPIDFLEAKNPELLSVQKSDAYSENTGLVWDIRKDENLENYFRLTDAHIREYGKPEIFHTIGLAERSFSDDREDNMRLKLNVYRRIASHLKEKYPNAPLLIASWDLWAFYTPEEVQRLVSELDPMQAVILDYTSDTVRENNFTNWGIVGKFPWIFGVFSAYEPSSDIRGCYELTNERLRIAKADMMCKGLVLWPELSHGDTLVTEYFARNAWDEEILSPEELVDIYCHDRYSEKNYEKMLTVWRDFLPVVEMRSWSVEHNAWKSDGDIFVQIHNRTRFDDNYIPFEGWGENITHQKAAVRILRSLAEIETDDEQLRRDVYDISRTVLGRYIDGAIHLAEVLYAAKNKRLHDAVCGAEGLMKSICDLLAGHEDYSLFSSLERLRSVTETNPDFEKTLKQNAENNYCRSYIYENAVYLYMPEMEILLGEAERAFTAGREMDYGTVYAQISLNRERYYQTPLADMQSVSKNDLSKVLNEAADILEAIDFDG